MKSEQQTAKHSAFVKPQEGSCLNVMDAEAHALQAQYRNRYVGVSIAPMFNEGWDGYLTPRPFAAVPLRAY